MAADPAATLGVDPDATAEEIRAAFRRCALSTHPDRGGDRGQFQAVVSAYRTLVASAPVGTPSTCGSRRADAYRVALRLLDARPTDPPAPSVGTSRLHPCASNRRRIDAHAFGGKVAGSEASDSAREFAAVLERVMSTAA